MPRDRTAAVNKLAGLSALAATREWERAALIATLVKPGQGRTGRPRKVVSRNENSGQKQYTIVEFTKLGIYGFRTHNSVRAYLKAWALSGKTTPEWGERIILPSEEFPDAAELYGLNPADNIDDGPAPPVDSQEDSEGSEDTEDAEEAAEQPSSGRSGPAKPERTMLDSFLAVLDKTDPGAVLHGQPADKRELLIKTLRSWLESLEELAQEAE